MYTNFYGLLERPFNVTPDPKYLFLSTNHKEAFAHLLYGVKQRSGFVVLTGEVGTGKTTLCRALLSQMDLTTEIAFIFNPYLSEEELLKSINQDFGIHSTGTTKKELIDELNNFLLDSLRAGKNMILLIDEAQSLTVPVLELIRLLSNLETDTEKLLQIILVGQPELDEHLSLAELRQLNQRVTARYHLPPLNATETQDYIAHRIGIAGGSQKVRFIPSAYRLIYRFSGGVPRLINVVCDRALLAGYTVEANVIDSRLVKQAIKEVEGDHPGLKAKAARGRPAPARSWGYAVTLAAFLGLAAVGWFVGQWYKNTQPTPSLLPLEQPTRPAPALSSLSGPEQEERQSAAPETTPAEPEQPSSPTVARAAEIGEKPPSQLADRPPVTPAKPEVEEPAIDEPVAEPARVAKVEVKEPTLKVPPFIDIMEDVDSAESSRLAMRAVLDVWNADLSSLQRTGPIHFFIDTAAEFGLKGYRFETNWTTIGILDLPCILEVIRPSDGRTIRIAVVGRGPDRIHTSLDKVMERPLTFEDIRPFWLGRTYIFWRDFESFGELLYRGADGEPIARLQQLLITLGYDVNDPRGVFSDGTDRAVRSFQRDHRLDIDGLVGPRTQLALYNAHQQYETPLLSRKGREDEREGLGGELPGGELPGVDVSGSGQGDS